MIYRIVKRKGSEKVAIQTKAWGKWRILWRHFMHREPTVFPHSKDEEIYKSMFSSVQEANKWARNTYGIYAVRVYGKWEVI